MPFTPYHFGLGLLVKAALPRTVSLTAFVAANVAIDVETALNMLARRAPLHAALHTFPAAAAVGLVVGLAVWALGRAAAPKGGAPWGGSETMRGPAVAGGLIGGLSHPFLDGIMHADIRPFLPLTEANPLYRLVGVEALHEGCLVAGVAGLGWLFVRWAVSRGPRPT